MTHCTSTIVAFRFACSAGNATLTTVPSMNAMLEASVVAVSTQRPEDFEQGAAVGYDWIIPSSQGSRMNAAIFATNNRQTNLAPHGFLGASRGNAAIGRARPQLARRGESASLCNHDVDFNIRKTCRPNSNIASARPAAPKQ